MSGKGKVVSGHDSFLRLNSKEQLMSAKSKGFGTLLQTLIRNKHFNQSNR